MPVFDDLLPVQREVWPTMHAGLGATIGLQTGAGKTFLARCAAAAAVADGQRVVMVVPLRALAAELYPRWQEALAPVPVGLFSGEFGASLQVDGGCSWNEARVAIATYEAFESCTRRWRDNPWLAEVGLLLVDELHLIGDGRRGARLDGMIARFRRLNPLARVVGLSATLGNDDVIAGWLGGRDARSDWRPVPLTWRRVDVKDTNIRRRRLIEEVDETQRAGGQSLVFVQSRRRAEEVARWLLAAGISARHHHAGLDADERQAVDAAFRSGELAALVATTTLAMGVNLPARKALLYDLQRFDGERSVPLAVREVRQLAGRAGRPGLDEQGEVVLFVPPGGAVDFEHAPLEPTVSALADRRALAEQVLVEVATGLSSTPAQVGRALASTLAGHQRVIPGTIEGPIAEMLAAGMLEPHVDDAGRLRATRLGRVAVRHFLLPESVTLLRNVLDVLPDATLFDLLLLAMCTPDAPVLTVTYEALPELSGALAAEPSWLLEHNRAELAALLGCDGRRLLSALAAAVALRRWTRQGTFSESLMLLGGYATEGMRLVEAADRLLTAACAVLSPEGVAEEPSYTLLPDGRAALPDRVRALRAMVVGGVDESLVSLTAVSGIGPVFARRLAGAGVVDLEVLALSDVPELAAIAGVGTARAARWIEAAGARVAAGDSALRFIDLGPRRAEGVAPPPGVDLYRLRRARELAVEGDGTTFYVRGGAEPHVVQLAETGLCCDCPDAAAGRTCKHVLAIRLFQGDRALQLVVESLEGTSAAEVNVYALWCAAASRAESRSTGEEPGVAEAEALAQQLLRQGGLLRVSSGASSWLADPQRGLAVVSHEGVCLTPYGRAVARAGLPLPVAGGIRGLLSDLCAIDPEGKRWAQWGREDLLVCLQLLCPELATPRSFSADLERRVAVTAVGEGGLLAEWLVGPERAGEVFGSLGLYARGRAQQVQRYRTGITALASARMAAALLDGTSVADVAQHWGCKELEPLVPGWFALLRWLSATLVGALNETTFGDGLAPVAVQAALAALRVSAVSEEAICAN